MSKRQWYSLRLVLGLTAMSLTLACTSLLDLDSLKSKPKPDALDAAVDAPPATDQKTERKVDQARDTKPPTCVVGQACTVPGKAGICAASTWASCSPTPSCPQKTQPQTEACGGGDQNCNGQADTADPAAHEACGAGKFCNGSACAAGCWNAAGCSQGNTCNTGSHQCVCGTAAACVAPNVCTTVGTAKKCCPNGACPGDGGVDKPPVIVDKPSTTPDTKPAPDTKGPDPDTKPTPDTVAWPDQSR